ncbi:amidohydrolase family protein [Elongatibacter sediminis]|uniref:Amidohydrolase family protein n=1 Tax=Elongatibacter sediminis TaxID=3119006 RepID=A0AAW9R9S5_9GAMM
MRSAPLLALLITTALAPGPAAGGSCTETDSLLLDDIAVIDVRSGTVQANRDVVIRCDRIEAVRANREPGTANASRRLDGRGRYVMPGLWDMHVHVLWDDAIAADLLPRFLAWGVTGIRDMGGDPVVTDRFRNRARSDPAAYPRIAAAGPMLDGPQPVHPGVSRSVKDAAEAVTTVESLAAHGTDFIKVYTLLPRDAFFAAAAAATRLGLPIAGHVPAEVTLAEAAAAGMASMEHLRDELGQFCRPAPATACDAAITAFSRNGTFHTPTLVTLRANSIPGYAESPPPELAGLPPSLRAEWNEQAARHRNDRDGGRFDDREARFRHALALTALLADRDIPLLAGTDAGNPFLVPGRSLHDELEWLVRAGLSPAEALRAAVTAPADFLHEGETHGAVAPGFSADLVILDANPLTGISNTRRLVAVVRAGQLVIDRSHQDGQ